jgi:hypothetical protein
MRRLDFNLQLEDQGSSNEGNTVQHSTKFWRYYGQV